MGALSRGCGSCKRRKVKCDETHPTCTRCQIAGIECAGYVQRLRFVDERPRMRRSMAVAQAQSLEYSTVTNKPQAVFHSGRIPLYAPLDPALFSTNAMLLTAFKDDIFISYLLSKLFEGDDLYPLDDTRTAKCGSLPKEWTPELVANALKPRHKSWDALAAIVFGQAHKSRDVITDALKLYGHALSELREKLSDAKDRQTDSTLASMTALYMYEILVSKMENGWMLHANGLEWLLERRGPWRQKFYAGKSIFLEHRILLISKSIISGQSTFLRDPIWKTVPWEDDPTSKSAIDYLVDIGADITEHLAQFAAYTSSKISQELRLHQLTDRIATSLVELNVWWQQWEAEHPQSVIEVTSTTTTSVPLFPTLLEYDLLSTALTVCLYDAMRILLLQLWHMVQEFRPAIHRTDQGVLLNKPNETDLLGITSDTKALACEILRSIKYSYGKSRRFIGTGTFLFILHVVYGCFDQGSKEAVWVARHGWADLSDFDDIEDANLLRRLLPLGQIKVGDPRLHTPLCE